MSNIASLVMKKRRRDVAELLGAISKTSKAMYSLKQDEELLEGHVSTRIIDEIEQKRKQLIQLKKDLLIARDLYTESKERYSIVKEREAQEKKRAEAEAKVVAARKESVKEEFAKALAASPAPPRPVSKAKKVFSPRMVAEPLSGIYLESPALLMTGIYSSP